MARQQKTAKRPKPKTVLQLPDREQSKRHSSKSGLLQRILELSPEFVVKLPPMGPPHQSDAVQQLFSRTSAGGAAIAPRNPILYDPKDSPQCNDVIY
jgi:hypothetical protein